MSITQDFVKIVEVGPRDGLQNVAKNLSIEQRIEFVNLLSNTGLSVIEVGAFVSEKWVPQMAGSGEVFKGIQKKSGVSYSVLVPNIRGYEQAKACGVQEIALFVAASETFSMKNINKSIDESLILAQEVANMARLDGVKVRGYISCVLGCPYEGEIGLRKVLYVAKKLIDLGCYEVSLGDTIGVGTVPKAKDMIKLLKQEIKVSQLAAHFHDTYGQALVNIYACLEEGVRTIDSSVAGLGGCPYAKGATGNVATEHVLYMCEGLGLKTNIDYQALLKISSWLKQDFPAFFSRNVA